METLFNYQISSFIWPLNNNKRTIRIIKRRSTSSIGHQIACSLLAIILFNEMIVDTWQQIQQQGEEIQFNYRQGDRHHIVKRKMKGIGRSFGFGKKPKSSKPRQQASAPYPKQPSYNPGYPVQSPSSGGSLSGGSAYPKQPGYNPNYMSGSHSGNPAGPPPPYPGLGNNRASGYPQPSSGSGYAKPPPYPQQPGFGYGNNPAGGAYGGNYGGNTFGNNMAGGNMFGSNQRTPFGSNSYGSGFNSGGYRKNKGLGIGRNIGSAGFGALAGTALGAYGGYKLGRMVGGLGRMGHYGYYNDHGRYMKCDPPKTIKVDPETNVSYIPLEEDYDRRCAYFDRPPPAYIEPSMLRSAATIITNTVNFTMIFAFIITALFTQMFIWKQQKTIRI